MVTSLLIYCISIRISLLFFEVSRVHFLSIYKFTRFLNKIPVLAYNLLSWQPLNQTLTKFDAKNGIKEFGMVIDKGLLKNTNY
jgi:hypothetical protein